MFNTCPVLGCADHQQVSQPVLHNQHLLQQSWHHKGKLAAGHHACGKCAVAPKPDLRPVHTLTSATSSRPRVLLTPVDASTFTKGRARTRRHNLAPAALLAATSSNM